MSSEPPPTNPPPKPQHWHLVYTYCDGVLEKRVQYRADHLSKARKAVNGGKLQFGGLTSSKEGPPDGAVFVFGNSSREEVESFAKADPYVEHGIVTDWQVKPFLQIIGNGEDLLPK
ncbi:hypothetical protein WJX73_003128 [Symbiochloris irregularis]|uniref:YCII-related domain-containing protein n=1 Tax=Symbiochloris irregularis TaxID=706552 RepID=A0AAW1NPD5_9CHLO